MYKVIVVVLFLSVSCTHSIHLVNHSGFDKNPAGSRTIKAYAEQFVVMGAADDVNYVDEAWNKIRQQCSSGKLEDLSTQFSTSHGFLSWTNKILIQANCRI